jgi:hypothetical protein
MVVREPSHAQVSLGDSCQATAVGDRVLRFLAAGSGKQVIASMRAGLWEEDPDLAGVLICRVGFEVEVAPADSYEVTVDDSPAYVITHDDLKDNLEFLDPAQFYDPESYVHGSPAAP